MEQKIIVIIICVVILLGVVLTTNRKKITKIVKTSKCAADLATDIQPYDSRGGNEAGLKIKEGYDNVKRNANRVQVHLNPCVSNRSTICSTDACTYCDPYNKQLMTICNNECKKESC